MESNELLVKLHHCRRTGVKQQNCNKGLRQYCSKYGIDYSRLVLRGIPIKEIEHIKDREVQAAIANAKLEAENGK